ncbi:hypothetical protein Poly24_08820 [Rosistilla carotiformis]|uniref:Uncharacterized protein n=1 Tax=Rosistilla carotiformis TaxID=2528017 RepID=A0A518JNR0_9BACT|nr:hypothetical protein Poly24_08820 [Rosistilla carotiformis]
MTIPNKNSEATTAKASPARPTEARPAMPRGVQCAAIRHAGLSRLIADQSKRKPQ